MSQDIKADVNWDDLDDTSSEEAENDSGSESNGSDHNEKEIKSKPRHDYHQDKRDHWEHSEHKYGDHKRSKQNRNYNDRNPNSNLELYYRNDPDFFVKVIKQEAPPHELRIRLKKKDFNSPDLSKKDVSERLKTFGIEKFEYTVLSDIILKITIFLNDDSEKVAKIYSALYDNAFKEFKEFRANVYYERDTQVLEQYADIEAEEYYKNQSEQNYEYQDKGYHKKNHDHKNHFRDDVSTKKQAPENHLAGFNK